MGRGRSPSPGANRRDRRRSRSRDRDRRRENHRHRRSRSRSPFRRRSRSRSPRRRSPPRRRSRSRSRDRDDRLGMPSSRKQLVDHRPKVNEEELKKMDPEDADMMRMMGFSGFDSTKGKHVHGNEEESTSSANITLKRKFRQYMNRRGGFNRPLDFIA